MSVVALPTRRWRRLPGIRWIARRLLPGQVPFFAAAVIAVSLLVLGVVSLQAVLSETSFEMRALTKRTADLQANYTRLKLTVAELSSPERIASEGQRLGLRLPDDVRTLPVNLPPNYERSIRISAGTPLPPDGRDRP